MLEEVPNCIPEFEPDEEKRLNSFFEEIDNNFPDKVIIWSEWNHELLDKDAAFLCKYLGYPNGRSFLEAFGYTILEGRKEEVEKTQKNILKHDNAFGKEASVIEKNKEEQKPMKTLKAKKIGSFFIVLSIVAFMLCAVFAYISYDKYANYYIHAKAGETFKQIMENIK